MEEPHWTLFLTHSSKYIKTKSAHLALSLKVATLINPVFITFHQPSSLARGRGSSQEFRIYLVGQHYLLQRGMLM